MDIKRIYLHWTATPYIWKQPGHYHTVVQGDGQVVRLTPYDHFLGQHTYRRNVDAVGLAIACMGGKVWDDYPPTKIQIDALCQEVADLANRIGWNSQSISIKTVLTHAEAASCLDGCHPHDNYGPCSWGGTGERWDLMRLEKNGSDNGGDILRDKIKDYMQSEHDGEAPLKTVEIDCNGCQVKGLLFSNLKTYAPIRDLASCYGLATDWNPDKRRVVLYGDTMPNPKYLYNDLGLSNTPVVDVCHKNGSIIMPAFLRDGMAYVRVSEFADEFNISLLAANGTIKLGPLSMYGG